MTIRRFRAARPTTHRTQGRGRIASISDKVGFANETLPENWPQKSSQHIESTLILKIQAIVAEIPAERRFPATVPALQQHFGGKRL
jgi:hypothetical protein